MAEDITYTPCHSRGNRIAAASEPVGMQARIAIFPPLSMATIQHW